MISLSIMNNYENTIEKLGVNKFFIFGNTRLASIFYVYCKKKEIESNIVAFVVTDLSRDTRKIHTLHGIPVWDINELFRHSEIKYGFLGANTNTINKIIIPAFKDKNYNLYAVSMFVHNLEYYLFINECYNCVAQKYIIKDNLFDSSYIDLYPNNQGHKYYKYFPRFGAGVATDNNIFGEDIDVSKLMDSQLGDYVLLNETSDIKSNSKLTIYAAKSHFDHELKEEYYTPNTKFIQVGAALTDTDICELKDNTGDNISFRNRDYCEMSAVYWAWKNDKTSDYIGLCHYRRRFVIDEKMMNYFLAENYDAMFTVPKLTDGGMREEFVERNYFLTPEMWELTENAIKKLSPDYYNSWIEYGKSYFLISCNMFIMRRDIFNDYCSWVFRILEEVDSFYKNHGIQRNDRYLGYIAECLTTVYVMKNKGTLKKCYVELKMLESK